MTHTERIGTLMFRYTRHELSPQEKAELDEWINQSPDNDFIFREIIDPENIRKHFKKAYEGGDEVLEQLREEYPQYFKAKNVSTIRHLVKYMRYAAAVVITTIFWPVVFSPGISAGGYSATVISPSGVKDNLNSAWDDFLRGFREGYAGVVRESPKGQLVYIAPSSVGMARDKNYTLFTKRGGEFGLKFADGTMIWVKPATTIQYPANFSQDTIRVRIDGEAYFEIPDSLKHIYLIQTGFSAQQKPTTINPLRSGADAMQIVTKAAHFNVISYADEPVPMISLVSGTAIVRLDSAKSSIPVTVTAGQQVKPESNKLQVGQIQNEGDIIAWKDNQTSFHNADIKTIMREIGRWYNAEVVYEGTIPDRKYSITISRDAKISVLLDRLGKQGGFFMVHGKTITVKY